VGEKIVRECPMLEGTTVSLSEVKDEIILQGNDIENVSQSAASITDKTRVKNKDVSCEPCDFSVLVRRAWKSSSQHCCQLVEDRSSRRT
jgi:ribosomal protein L6P/L9E